MEDRTTTWDHINAERENNPYYIATFHSATLRERWSEDSFF